MSGWGGVPSAPAAAPAAVDMASLLLAARSTDNAQRDAAEARMRQWEHENFGQYLCALVAELANNERPENIRQLAGLQIKNALDSSSEMIAIAKQTSWRGADATGAGQKEFVRNHLLSSLIAVHPKARTAAAQAIAKVGKVDIPDGQWTTLVPSLVAQVLNPAAGSELKSASVTALGFLCEELDALEQAQTDSVLSAIVTGMHEAQPLEVRRASAAAMLNVLDFAQSNFEDEKVTERDSIVAAICDRARDGDRATQQSAFECIVRIAEIYYSKIERYIDTLAALTSGAAIAADENIAVRAVEFWTALANEEKGMTLENPENKKYILKFAQPLVQMLTSLMTRVSEDDTDDTYTVAQAAALCLTSASIALEDAIVDHVMHFVGASYGSDDWHVRDAATVAFGCIMEGPSAERLKPVIASALPSMLMRIAGPSADASIVVRDSTSWTVSRVVEHHFAILDFSTVFTSLINTVLAALDDEARVAAKVAYIAHNIALHIPEYELADGSTPLSPHFAALCTKLLLRSDKDDWNDAQLRVSCMDAVAALIAASTAAEHEFMFNLLTECVRRLEVTFTKPVTTADERTDLESSQVFMCALIQFLLPELGESTLALVPNIMALATRVIDAAAAIATEEAYRVVGTVAQLLEGRMADYLPGFYPRLRSGLVMRDVPNVCAAALWCASEVIRYSASAISAYINDIITILLDTLRAPEITRKVGPECLSVFGDIATALGVGISEYFAGIMTVMATAAATPDPDSDDDDEIEYVYRLRRGAVDAWCGLFQALTPDQGAPATVVDQYRAVQAIAAPYVPGVLATLKPWIEKYSEPDEDGALPSILRPLIGLLGDIAMLVGKPAMKANGFTMDQPWLKAALNVAHKEERDSWEGETHDESGQKKTTVADFTKLALPKN